MYQPLVTSWPERQTLNARIAMEPRPTPDKPAVLGTVEARIATRTDLATRLLTLSDGRLISARPMSRTRGHLRAAVHGDPWHAAAVRGQHRCGAVPAQRQLLWCTAWCRAAGSRPPACRAHGALPPLTCRRIFRAFRRTGRAASCRPRCRTRCGPRRCRSMRRFRSRPRSASPTPGRLVRRNRASRRPGAGHRRAGRDLHHPDSQPAVPLHLRARICRHARHGDLRLQGRLHHGIRQRRRRRLRHRLLLLQAVPLPGAESHLLPQPVTYAGATY